MITIYILKCKMRGIRYGIGTYINQLLELLKYDDIKFTIINYHTDNSKEFSVNPKSSRLTEINIPTPFNKPNSEKGSLKYASRIIDLLSEFLPLNTNSIFITNFPDALPIVKQLKLQFPSVPIISVIHSAQWQFSFMANKKNLLKRGKIGII